MIHSDVQKLMLIVSGDHKLLYGLVGGVQRIEQQLDAGVNLNDEAVEKLRQAVLREAENSRQVRACPPGDGPCSEACRAAGTPIADPRRRAAPRRGAGSRWR